MTDILLTEKFEVGFGKRDTRLDSDVSKNVFLRQTHSDILVHSIQGRDLSAITNETPEADAHWTRTSGLRLIVRTADCIPVVAFCPISNTAIAIHAGWRGVQKNIIGKTLQFLACNHNVSTEHLQVWIGPHIMQNSFEVDEDVKQLLLRAHQERSASAIETFPNVCVLKGSVGAIGKSKIDLHQMALAQLFDCGVDFGNVTSVFIDTVTSHDHHSFRRDKADAGRNLNWIQLL